MHRDGKYFGVLGSGLAAAGLLFTALVAASPGVAADGHALSASRASAADVGWVTGVVVDEDGKPVVGDLVNAIGPREVPEGGILAEESDRRDFTDEQGRFRVRQASPHGYLIQICDPEPSYPQVCKETAQGVKHLITYAGPDGITDSWVLHTRLFPTSAADRDLGSITVKPQSYVHGTLTGGAFQSIQILRTNGTVAYNNFTDAQGRYRFQGLAPGHYRIGAEGEGALPWRSDVFELGPNEDRLVNGSLDPGAVIHGVVRSGGQPVAFQDLLVKRLGGRVVAATTTDENGLYRIGGLRPGRFLVGVPHAGTEYRPHMVSVTLDDPHARVAAPITLVRGAVITLDLRAGGQPAIRAKDELRNSAGRPILGLRNFNGTVTYPGLTAGQYTVVAANDAHFTIARVTVKSMRTYDLGTRVLDRPTLTLTGTTAPRAVVEALTGDQCPPGEQPRQGTFHEIERADDAGHYTLTGLVPGHYMLGSDGWPANYAPYCRSDVLITHDRRAALPLEVGATVAGKMVYAGTHRPVITTLAYQLTYPPGLPTNPTDEHPSRDRTSGASGLFLIDRLAAGTVTGRLSQGADTEQISSPKFLVIFPFQDGTPYYLTSRPRTIDIAPQERIRLGEVPLYLHR